MRIGLVALPKSGKITVFNALTRGHADTTAFLTAEEQPNLGTAKVPEKRLSFLAETFMPKRVVSAEVQHLDPQRPPSRLLKKGSLEGPSMEGPIWVGVSTERGLCPPSETLGGHPQPGGARRRHVRHRHSRACGPRQVHSGTGPNWH